MGDLGPHPGRLFANTVELAGEYSLGELAAALGGAPVPDAKLANIFNWTHRRPVFCCAPGMICDEDGFLLATKRRRAVDVEPISYSAQQRSRGGQQRARMKEYELHAKLVARFADGMWRTIAELQAAGIPGKRQAISDKLKKLAFQKRQRAAAGRGRPCIEYFLPKPKTLAG
jgi:hypothetical protein